MKLSAGYYWLPRIMVILAIFIIGFFALDSFSPDQTFWHNIGSFLMNLIPAYILIIILIIAWKWELAGGIILTLTGIACSILVFIMNFKRTHSVSISLVVVLIVCVPIFVSGILFIIHHFSKKKEISLEKS